MTKVSWLKRGNDFQRVEGDFSNVDKLPVGIYNICFEAMGRGWYLQRYADKFVFDYKIYGLQTSFVQYVYKTFQETTGNLGIMMNGVRGAGKTVSSKVLANLLGLPIIIVKDMGEMNQSMIEYLSGFNFDCTLFFDEFEKNFSEKDSTVLQIMDGVYNIGYRKVFLLTTNSLSVNENLLDRPSRIRYIKEFGNLELSTVKEYLEDNLNDKSCTNDLVEYIDTLKISTIDILKAIVSEVNIHGIDQFKKAKNFFNVSTNSYDYRCIRGYLEESDMESMKKNKGNLISLFAKQSKEYDNPTPRPTVKDCENPTEEEQKKLQEWQNIRHRDFNSMSYSYIKSDSKIKSLKVGDEFNEEEIVQIDTRKNIIVTKYDEEIWFYQVLNPASKPSLYTNYNAYNAYFD